MNWQPGRLTGREQPQRIERPIRHLGTQRDLGIHLPIDDFGTGYSSLASLKQLPYRCPQDRPILRVRPRVTYG
jgi:hypothetical protein